MENSPASVSQVQMWKPSSTLKKICEGVHLISFAPSRTYVVLLLRFKKKRDRKLTRKLPANIKEIPTENPFALGRSESEQKYDKAQFHWFFFLLLLLFVARNRSYKCGPLIAYAANKLTGDCLVSEFIFKSCEPQQVKWKVGISFHSGQRRCSLLNKHA